MKRILYALLALTLVFCFSACGDKDNGSATNTVGDSVDQNTLSLVNVAFDTTEELVGDAEALGFEVSYRRNLTYDTETDAMRIGITYNYIGTGENKQFLFETTQKYGDIDDTVMMYSDGKNIYGYKADTTYLIVNDNITAEYLGTISENITVFNASDLEVVNTVIMDTDSGGHAFVLDYKSTDSGFDPVDIFGPIYAEAEYDIEIKPVSLKVSGIIDSDGRLTNETVTYEYTYEYEDQSTVDPDNSEATGVMKTATVKLVAEMVFDYDISAIPTPSDITLVPEGTEGDGDTTEGDGETDGDGSEEDKDEEAVVIKELSLSDFMKLGQQTSTEESKK